MKEALDALCEIVPQEEMEEPKRRWRAVYNERYWYFCGAGSINTEKEVAHPVDDDKYKLGNYFKTREEAEAYRDNLITKQELKDLAFKLNGYRDVNWKDGDEDKVCIILERPDNSLFLHHTNYRCFIGQVYCNSDNFLDEALNQIGWERLVKLIKSGV